MWARPEPAARLLLALLRGLVLRARVLRGARAQQLRLRGAEPLDRLGTAHQCALERLQVYFLGLFVVGVVKIHAPTVRLSRDALVTACCRSMLQCSVSARL